MHGQTMEIMKIAVKTLLTTLEENDFVNIISFNDTAKWTSCFDTLVQANRRNKQILSKSVDSIIDKKMANLSVGLDFAFKAFEKFKEMRAERWAGAECNQVIMLFSDGGTEQAWDVLQKYNANKTIASDYVKVLGRPLVLSSTRSFEWTNFYLDAMDLGMMTTVTLPVFNRTDMYNQSLVGVMGVDVALSEMIDFEPSYQIGPVGYAFGINQNGYVVFHPNLKTDFEFIPDPPHLDLLDVEIGSFAKEELRDAMINMDSSNRSLTSLLKMPEGRFIVEHRLNYYFTPLNKTSFSIAIVIPADRTHFLHIENVEIPPGFDVNKYERGGMYLAPWKYCHGKVLKLGIADLLKNLSLTARHKQDSCKMELLHRLLWDLRKTDDIMHYWQSEEQDEHRDGVIATFVQSESGLTRIYPPNEGPHVEPHTNPSKSSFYQRAFYGQDYVFMVPDTRFNASSNLSVPVELVINIVKTISFARSGITYKPAVVGVVMDPAWLYSYLLDNCPDVDYLACYLVDDGGFIVSVNQPDYLMLLGTFLGEHDSEIMTELYKKNVYVRNEDFNYEDRCEKPPAMESSGFRAPALPFYMTLSSLKFGWLFDLEAWSYLKYWLLSLFSFTNLHMSEALPEFYELANETTCTTHEAQYYWGKYNRSYSGIIACSNCTRDYSLKKVGQMNIILLVTEKPCSPTFCKSVPPLLQAKTEVLNASSNPCDRPLRYRRRPEKCFFFSHDENSSECGSIGTKPLPHFALCVELLCLLVITKMIYTDNNIPINYIPL
ncbi:hypothetical protein JTE90_009721 [Oedothorax gibbosus]|uniref:Voltage-dependent calcium channel alpha-2/delta subunit conserved region domain-containing protein n=1 Tax=Oedothorax gibbosus TaxID=931172 RepID=A0AAV6V883_9ARAC|nr:hypothetical protein JTE90_009721 [Oedothorax gibbosus]